MPDLKRLKPCLDLGHGGKDSGAVGNNLIEKDINLEIGFRAAHLFNTCGHDSIMTRDTDTFIELSQRPKIAIDKGCDLFISIHCNSNTNANPRGLRIYTHGLDAKYKEASEKLAVNILEEIKKLTLWTTDYALRKDTEIYGSGFAVLRRSVQNMPAVLMECGFVSNLKDAALLQDPLNLENTALAIMVGAIASQLAN
jgi:N-acetylmuramoyl-L-alanine amidase